MGRSPAVDSVVAHRACLRVAQGAPRPRRTASNLGLPQFGFGHDGVLAWGAWRTFDGVDLQGREWTPWTSHIRLSMLFALGMVWGNNQQRMWRLIYLGLWLAFTCHRLIHFRPLVAFGIGMVALACDTWRRSQTNRNGVPCWSVGTDCWFGSSGSRRFSLGCPHPLTSSPPTRLGETRTHIFPRAPCQKVDIGCICFGVNRKWETAWKQVSTISLDQRTTKDSPTETGCHVT